MPRIEKEIFYTPLVLAAASSPSERLARQMIAEVALAQVEAIDPAWPAAQRDCAGLVRFAYRAAFRKLAPARLERGLWTGPDGRPAAFADAATLLGHSFVLLGRDDGAARALRSGDLLAFARPNESQEPVMHLMLVVLGEDPAHLRPLVVYHPGEPGAKVRVGALDDLRAEAPAAWRPVPENPAFLGFFRFKEWMP